MISQHVSIRRPLLRSHRSFFATRLASSTAASFQPSSLSITFAGHKKGGKPVREVGQSRDVESTNSASERRSKPQKSIHVDGCRRVGKELLGVRGSLSIPAMSGMIAGVRIPSLSRSPKTTNEGRVPCRRGFTTKGVARNDMAIEASSKLDYPLPPPAPPPLNEVQVPLISDHLRSQIFPPLDSPFSPPPPTASAISISLAHLKSHGLLQPPPPAPKKLNAPTSKPKSEAAAIDFLLPQLQGPTIAHHFQTLAHYTAEPYLSMATSFSTVEFAPMPDPQTWILSPGWTYYSLDGSWKAIDYPEASDDTLVFDVETLPYSGGDYPVMAVAAGRKGWYAWCSPWLTGDSDQPNHLIPFHKDSINSASTSSSATTPAPISTSPLPFPSTSSLLESPNDPPRLLIGHNVLYDRARVGSEYTLRRPATRWLDTQSLHVATAGLTNPQRPAWMLYRKNQGLEAAEKARNSNAAGTIETKVESRQNAISTLPTSTSKSIPPAPFKAKQWQDVSSMNSLVEVARLHCGIEVDKSLRNVFIDPATTISDVRDNFEALVGYCATDVLNTQAVYRVVLPKFLKRCPHPASFSGILVMSQPVLPVDYKWPEYLERAQLEYETRLTGVKNSLHELAEEARKLMGKMGKNGKWEWEEDLWLRQLDWSPRKARRLPKVTGSVKSKKAVKEADSPAAYPTWFAAIKPTNASRFPLQTPLAAILLQTTWRSFPTYFSRSRGWLFAVPSRKKFVPGSKEEQVDPSTLDETDYRIKSLKGLKLWTITSPGRCMTLLSKRNLALGMLGSKYPEMGMLAELEKNPTPKQLKPIVDKLELLAKEAMEAGNTIDGENNLWLRQLDWSPLVGISQSATAAPTIQPSAVTKVDLVWPQWYLDLDKVGVGLDISIGKRAAPLLLKLQWKGYPVCYSKQHGWTFRVSKESSADFFASDPTLKPCDFDDVADASLKDDTEALFVKLPHEDGEEKNVGSPLSKSFVGAFDVGVLSSEYPAAAAALAMNASCSYWASSKERIVNQMVVWEGDATKSAPTPAAIANSSAFTSTQGLILPQVTPMGTITRRAVERTWLTASNAKKNRVGSELKSMIRAPPGYAIVGADVDSEELWICSVMGDAQFGIHGATAIGWMTLEGTKSAGTDLHSKSASILGISRDDAKVFNYSRIYGAGVRHAVQLLLKSNPALTKDEATGLAKNLYASTKGLTSRAAFNRDFWYGGTESFVFNKLEQIAMSDEPQTPALGCGITDALTKAYLPTKGRDTYLPSRINWVVQSSGVDYLHLLLVSMEYLTRRFNIDARYMISVHDEIRYLVKEEDKHRAAMALQISNLWTRALFSYRLQMGDLPQSCAFFSAVDLDHCFRKEVNMTCLTPSNPDSIPFGESLDIAGSLSTTSNGSLFADGRSMLAESTLPIIPPIPDHYLDPVPAKSQQHRVDQTDFLVAQTETSVAAIGKLWRQSKGHHHTTTTPPPVKSTSKHYFGNESNLSSLNWNDISDADKASLQQGGTGGTTTLRWTRKPISKSYSSRFAKSTITKRVEADILRDQRQRIKRDLKLAQFASESEEEEEEEVAKRDKKLKEEQAESEGEDGDSIPDELMDEHFTEWESFKRPNL